MKGPKILLTAVLLLIASATFAQEDTNADSHTVTIGIPQVALLDLESATELTVTLDGTAPTEAGEKVVFDASNNDLWINYTSIKSTANPSRGISVQITDGTVPAGLQLTVEAASYSGSGAGTTGTSVGSKILTSTAQNLITGIGSAYTGNGKSNGHNLTYSLTQVGSYADLDFDNSSSLIITYTLSDN